MSQLIELVDKVDLQKAYEFLRSPDTGGIDLFVGTVRNHANGKDVLRLEFESYEPMALRQMQRIAERAAERWSVHRLLVQHVLGARSVGEPVVIIGVSAAHRQAAFDACRFLIDELKTSVPIWKKEFYTDSSIWVAAHP